MYTYTILASGSIQRSDGAVIPIDPLNTDYQAYLSWVAAGNTPTSASSLSLESAQAAQTALVSAACQAAIYAGFPSSALGSANHYPASTIDQANLSTAAFAGISAALNAVPWAASTLQPAGALVAANGQIYLNLTTGTTGPNAPTWPSAIGVQELDGGAQWQIWTTPLQCESSGGTWALTPHTSSQIQQVNRDFVASRAAMQATNAGLAAQIAAVTVPEGATPTQIAAAVAQVQAINWS